MTGIFINYRTGADSRASELVEEVLAERYGADLVFRDGRSIRPRVDFPPELWERLRRSTVLLVLIGPTWLTAERAGRRRLDDPDDHVRTEIAEALRLEVFVVPVLLPGADLPTPEQLPADVRGLAGQPSSRLHQADGPGPDRYDGARLLADLELMTGFPTNLVHASVGPTWDIHSVLRPVRPRLDGAG